LEFDRDLYSIQEVRNAVKAAKAAQLVYRTFDQQKVDGIVAKIAQACAANAERLAKMAVEETGFGIWQDKVLKNLLGSTITYDSIKDRAEADLEKTIDFYESVQEK
jgi:acyl-CoA reductase-like NAD-dependent aldehyde dehydrogenase